MGKSSPSNLMQGFQNAGNKIPGWNYQSHAPLQYRDGQWVQADGSQAGSGVRSSSAPVPTGNDAFSQAMATLANLRGSPAPAPQPAPAAQATPQVSPNAMAAFFGQNGGNLARLFNPQGGQPPAAPQPQTAQGNPFFQLGQALSGGGGNPWQAATVGPAVGGA